MREYARSLHAATCSLIAKLHDASKLWREWSGPTVHDSLSRNIFEVVFASAVALKAHSIR